ncbi:sugar-transfer associated ATP-grasp domain-containing protein [Rubrivirga sp.]|uniref:sugar-transfer associated ATP-grasp domain-containing protein n=1 Tax=Rubrivirga sp. TaxID=1885344 RepID=UPI003B52C523
MLDRVTNLRRRVTNPLSRRVRRGLKLAETARVVRDRTGKSLAAQAREIAALRKKPGMVSAFDYYAYGLYDDARYSSAQKRAFVGWTYKALQDALNDRTWQAICDDKLISYAVFEGLSLPYPEVYAVYQPSGRTFGRVPALHTPEALVDFLRTEMRYPFFGKPVRDSHGGGATSVVSIDRDRDRLTLADGTETDVEDYVTSGPVRWVGGQRRQSSLKSGYLFQSRIVQHPVVERLSGGRVSSLRMVVLLWPDGPRLFRVTWKLPVGANITDHVIGNSGNVKCYVDRDAGRVEEAVRGPGPEGTEVFALGHHGTPIEAHPDTGEPLKGVELPDWDEAVALCLRAAAAFPGIRYQSWDLVLSADGPQVLELNFGGGVLQVPGGPGLNDDEFRQFMDAVGEYPRL